MCQHNPRPDRYNSLTCTECGKVFVANKINQHPINRFYEYEGRFYDFT